MRGNGEKEAYLFLPSSLKPRWQRVEIMDID